MAETAKTGREEHSSSLMVRQLQSTQAFLAPGEGDALDVLIDSHMVGLGGRLPGIAGAAHANKTLVSFVDKQTSPRPQSEAGGEFAELSQEYALESPLETSARASPSPRGSPTKMPHHAVRTAARPPKEDGDVLNALLQHHSDAPPILNQYNDYDDGHSEEAGQQLQAAGQSRAVVGRSQAHRGPAPDQGTKFLLTSFNSELQASPMAPKRTFNNTQVSLKMTLQ